MKTFILFVAFTLACFALSPTVYSLTPPPDGGYPNGNTAEGTNALQNLTSGKDNTAIGRRALFANRAGSFNTAVGAAALDANVNGVRNTATGYQALTASVAGTDNTANGATALRSLTTGNGNTAVGSGTLTALTNGSGNIAIGSSAGSTLTRGSNDIYIGNDGVAAESNTIRIGSGGGQRKTFINGISGAVVTGAAVSVNADGQLGTAPSSVRFKEQIKPMGKASEAIFALEPVTFRYKKEIDSENTPQFGLVAEDVEKVAPDLVVRDQEGRPQSVRYDQVNAMLLNEFLKARRKINEHSAMIVGQQERIDALGAGLQKVNAQLELSAAGARRTVNSR